ncbi:MAG: sulfite exporter TauE/SafE family protein [Verrucomicrobiales bacterium]|nr:sulfite exporter TauE/SafE family protein [Verrucomicrobiales bacterium]
MLAPDRILVAVAAALFIGISKAGFGGGLGMLTTPLCVLAFGAKDAIGILLPLLCAGDLFSLVHYWGKWKVENLKYLLPGVVLGVVIGIWLIARFANRGSSRELNLVIGLLAVAFVAFQVFKSAIFRAEGEFEPNHRIGLPFGLGTGITSTFAHGAGPVVSMFLIPQNLSKTLFVGTNVLIFTWVNWIKVPFFCLDQSVLNVAWLPAESLINLRTLKTSALLLPLVPLGVWMGVRLNRRFSETWFTRFIFLSLFLAGLQLIFNFDLAGWFGAHRTR